MSVSIVSPSRGTFTFLGVREAFGRSARVTEHPIEDGSTVSDHSQVQADLYTAELVVSGSPWDDDPNARRDDPVGEAIEFLDGCGRDGERLSIATNRRGFLTNMVLTAWPSEDTQVREGRFQLQARQVTLAEATAVSVELGVEEAAPAAFQPQQDAGSQPTVEDTNAGRGATDSSGASQSWLTQLGGLI